MDAVEIKSFCNVTYFNEAGEPIVSGAYTLENSPSMVAVDVTGRANDGVYALAYSLTSANGTATSWYRWDSEKGIFIACVNAPKFRSPDLVVNSAGKAVEFSADMERGQW